MDKFVVNSKARSFIAQVIAKPSLLLAMTLFSCLSLAQTNGDSLLQIGYCQQDDLAYEVFENPFPMSSKFPFLALEKKAGRNVQRMTMAGWRGSPSAPELEFPKYWATPPMASKSCKLTSPTKSSMFWETDDFAEVIQLQVQVFFIPESIDPETAGETLDELINTCVAIPLMVDVLCHTGGEGPLGCRKIRILNDRIEVEPRPGCPG